MADTQGVQVFVGPANRLELGTVTTGPAAATLETLSDRLQRLHLVIPDPSQEIIDAQTASAAAATASATEAAASKTEAQGARTAAEAAQAAAEAAAPTQAQVDEAVAGLLPIRIGIDVDGRPYMLES